MAVFQHYWALKGPIITVSLLLILLSLAVSEHRVSADSFYRVLSKLDIRNPVQLYLYEERG